MIGKIALSLAALSFMAVTAQAEPMHDMHGRPGMAGGGMHMMAGHPGWHHHWHPHMWHPHHWHPHYWHPHHWHRHY